MFHKKAYLQFNFGTRRNYLELRQWVYQGLCFCVFSLLAFLVVTNILQVHLFLQTHVVEMERSHQEEILAYYDELLKEYSVTYSKKEQGLNQQILSFKNSTRRDSEFVGLIGVPKNNVASGIGGDGKDLSQSDLVDRYTENLIDRKLELFKIGEGDKVVERDLASMADALAVVQDLDVELGEQKMILSYLPTLWPLKNRRGKLISNLDNSFSSQKGLEENSPKTFLRLKVDKPTKVVITGKGKVSSVSDEQGVYTVVVKHNFGIATIYKNLSEVVVKEGDFLNKGELLGQVVNDFVYKVQVGNKLEDPIKFALFKY